MDTFYYAVSDLEKQPPELIWVLVVIMLLISSVFVATALLIHRRLRQETRAAGTVLPIPMAAEYDAELAPTDRMEELRWMEELMESPAYGEPIAEQKPRGQSES